MNLSIKSKLLLGYSLILLLLILTGFFMVNKLSETNDRLGDLVDVSSKKVSLSQEILISVLDASRHEKNIILEKNISRKEYFKNRIITAFETIDIKIPILEDLADEKGKKILNEFKVIWNNYRETSDEIILLTLKNEDDKAIALSVTKGVKTRDDAIAIMGRLIAKNEKSMADDKILSDQNYKSALNLIIAIIILAFIASVAIAYWIIRGITQRILFISKEAEKIASREFTNGKLEDNSTDELKVIFNSLISVNDSFKEVTENANTVASGNFNSEIIPRSDKDALGNALKKMTVSLRNTTTENEKHIWLTSGQNQLNEILRGDQSTEQLANNTITFLSNYLNAHIGALYLMDEKDNTLLLSGQYAFSSEQIVPKIFGLNEGLIGQVAHEQKQISLTDINEENIQVVSTIINAKPKHVLIVPFLFDGKTFGVIEIGRLHLFNKMEQEFINTSMESVGISFNSAVARKKIQQLLEETQVQSEELQSQQEELRQINEELEEQAQNLKQQQEELQITNEELEEQTQALEMKNKEVETARYDIEKKTKQLEVSSKYKSEFLANMSHELRTPLNSLLILSKDLSDNRKQNLTTDQVESADIIYKSGQDLLVLINEVLDLSKIEAGKMNLNVERIPLQNLANDLQRNFKHQIEQKGLKLNVELIGDLPKSIRTDLQRLNQILKNIMSNAIKFTDSGEITISIQQYPQNRIAISITDTGIGIPEEKQIAVFEAFQQADGSTSRKYGGTGLGLSISRELARLLHGEIKLNSKVKEGSTFILIIPEEIDGEITQLESSATKQKEPSNVVKLSVKENSFLNFPGIDDDRAIIVKDDKVVLVIEDDLKFASVLLRQAHDKGFKCLAAASGEDGLILAEKYKPQAIILDIDLPGIDGLQVLAELKSNPATRHIPVHIASVYERTLKPIKDGAIEYLTKPVDKKQMDDAFNRIESFIARKMKNLLIVEDDANSRIAMRKLIGNGDVKCFDAETGKDALRIFKDNHIDCIVLDIGLPDISGFDLIQQFGEMKENNMPPIIVYTGKDLTKEENAELQKYAESIIIKGVKSEDRLLDETALFLHRTITDLPESKQKIITNLYDKEMVFCGKKILLVDDDMRNVFALSKILKERNMEIIKAENGINALEMLEKHPNIDLVLMDIMMPEMDGYEAMIKIRAQTKFKNLPIIALTAKAMKEDKQKCIDAGANDYITKPVDVERLLSLMRVWLSK